MVNELLKKIYAEHRVEDGEGNLVNPFPSAVPLETGQLLYDLVSAERLARTLEVGMGYGLSAQFIATRGPGRTSRSTRGSITAIARSA